MGYAATNGAISSNQTLTPLSIPLGITVPANTTSFVQLLTNLDASGGTAISAASQQTGSGITAGNHARNRRHSRLHRRNEQFTYTTAAGDTLANVVAAINANANFSASLSGNSLDRHRQ